MTFLRYYSALDADGKKQLAEKLETSIAYLSQLAHGHRKPGARILARIESATGGQVTPADMRPDLFAAPKLRARKVG